MLTCAEEDIKKAKTLAELIEDYTNGLKDHQKVKEERDNAFNVQNFKEEESIEDMKNITIRADGRYMIHKQIDGVRVFDYAKTQKEARQKLKSITKKVLTYESKQRKKVYTLKEWAFKWLETYKAPFIKHQSYLDLERYFKNDIVPVLGNKKLTALHSQDIQEFYNTFQMSRKKELIILYLQACLQKAVELDLITKNPCLGVVKDRKIKTEKKPFTIEEQELILKAIKNTDIEANILFYILTGLRKNEFNPNFIEEDLDIANNRLRAINEKQRSNIPVYKFIDLNPNYIKLILEQKEQFKYSPEVVGKKFKKILNNLKIEGSLHKLRHTFATNYYYLGVPAKLISSWLGHATVDITQNVYIGLTNKDIKEKLLKLYNNLLYKF